MTETLVNGLPLPKILVDLLEQNRWTHPGDDVINRLLPYLRYPIDFLGSVEAIRFESTGFLADDPGTSKIFREIRGAKNHGDINLPWRDVDLSFFVAVNRIPGDDIGIALDYRTDWSNPRVIASNWKDNSTGSFIEWEKVAPTFSQFVELVGL